MREIRTLRVMWRELEPGLRTSLTGHEGGNSGYRQGMFYRVTAPALDPTTSTCMSSRHFAHLSQACIADGREAN